MADMLRGRDLRIRRNRAGLSQKELADRLGIHKTFISALETEKLGEFPSPDFVERYVVACEVEAA